MDKIMDQNKIKNRVKWVKLRIKVKMGNIKDQSNIKDQDQNE